MAKAHPIPAEVSAQLVMNVLGDEPYTMDQVIEQIIAKHDIPAAPTRHQVRTGIKFVKENLENRPDYKLIVVDQRGTLSTYRFAREAADMNRYLHQQANKWMGEMINVGVAMEAARDRLTNGRSKDLENLRRSLIGLLYQLVSLYKEEEQPAAERRIGDRLGSR